MDSLWVTGLSRKDSLGASNEATWTTVHSFVHCIALRLATCAFASTEMRPP